EARAAGAEEDDQSRALGQAIERVPGGGDVGRLLGDGQQLEAARAVVVLERAQRRLELAEIAREQEVREPVSADSRLAATIDRLAERQPWRDRGRRGGRRFALRHGVKRLRLDRALRPSRF